MAPKSSTTGRSPNCSAEGGAQGPGTGGIVGDVENDLRPLRGGGKALEAARPTGLARTGSDALRGDVEALRGEFLGRGNGEREVAELMPADQRRDDLHLLAQDAS